MFEATILEGRALLQEVSGGETDGKDDALMGDETAHKKQPKTIFTMRNL
jgi:hypothetical protein